MVRPRGWQNTERKRGFRLGPHSYTTAPTQTQHARRTRTNKTPPFSLTSWVVPNYCCFCTNRMTGTRKEKLMDISSLFSDLRLLIESVEEQRKSACCGISLS